MSLTFTTLKTEFAARGFDYLDSTRQGYYVNWGYKKVCSAEDWPFLEATATGAAPLTISDLGSVEYAYDTVQRLKLMPMDRRNITDTENPDLTTTGTPYYYYLTSGTVVNVYPASTNALTVRYWKNPADLSAGGDVPIIPDTFNQLAIVDAAVYKAYLDSDNFDAAQQALQAMQDQVDDMTESMLGMTRDEPDDFIVSADMWPT